MSYIECIVHQGVASHWCGIQDLGPDASIDKCKQALGRVSKQLHIFIANDSERECGVVISEQRTLPVSNCILSHATYIGLYPADEAWELFELHRRML